MVYSNRGPNIRGRGRKLNLNFKNMNKYIGILALLALMSTEAQAQVLDTTVSPEVDTEVKIEAPRPPMTTAEKVIQAEARLKAQREELAPMDAKARREEALMQLKANNAANRAGVAETKAEIAEFKQEVRIRIADLRLMIENEQDEKQKEVLEARIKGREEVIEKLEDAIARTRTQSGKVVVQIEKMKTKGVETSKATGFVAEAEAKLAVADAKVIEAETILALSIEELTKESKEVLQDTTKAINTLIKEANSKLNDSAKALRDALVAKLKADASLAN